MASNDTPEDRPDSLRPEQRRQPQASPHTVLPDSPRPERRRSPRKPPKASPNDRRGHDRRRARTTVSFAQSFYSTDEHGVLKKIPHDRRSQRDRRGFDEEGLRIGIDNDRDSLFVDITNSLRWLVSGLTVKSPIVVQPGDPAFAAKLIEAERKRVATSKRLAIALGVPLVILTIAVLVLTTPLSGVRRTDVEIVGSTTRAQQLAINEAINPVIGVPLLRVDTAVIASMIEHEVPSVGKVTVRKRWLTGLRIFAETRTPVAIVMAPNGAVVVDGTGHILALPTPAQVEAAKRRMHGVPDTPHPEPAVKPDEPASKPKAEPALPIIVTPNPAGPVSPIQDIAIVNAAHIIAATPVPIQDYVTYWEADNTNGVRVHMAMFGYEPLTQVTLELGTDKNISEKFEVAMNLIKQLSGQGKTSARINVWAPQNPSIAESK